MNALQSVERAASKPAPSRIDPNEGARAVLGRLMRLLDADCVVALQTGTSAGQTLSIAGIGDEALRAVVATTGDTAARLLIDGAGRGNGYIDDRVERLAVPGVELEAIGIGRIFDSSTAGVVLALRRSGRLPFDLNAERAARRISEWVGDTLYMAWQMRAARRLEGELRGVLDLVDNAVIVLDAAGRTVLSNHAANLLLDAGDGLRRAGEMITASGLDDAVRLQMAIAHVRGGSLDGAETEPQQAPMFAVRRKGRRPLFVAVMRSAPRTAGGGAIFIHAVDPEIDMGRQIAPACALYGFTRAEARLAELLVAGASLADAATKLRIQAPTARTYLKQVFAKTGSNRQAGFIQLMLTSLVRTNAEVELTAVR